MLIRMIQISLVSIIACSILPIDARTSNIQINSNQSQLIREAEEDQYNIRRVEFLGNAHIRDYILRRRVLLREGDLFTRKNLVQSIRNLSGLKIIKPVRLKDVELRLDKTEKIVDMTLLVRERRRAR